MGPFIGWALIGATIGFTFGVILGALIMFLWRRLQEVELRAELQRLKEQVAPETVKESLRAFTGDAVQNLLQVAHQQFEGLMRPLGEMLGRLEQQLRELERNQAQEQGSLKKELDQLSQTIVELQKSTLELSGVLKASGPRGRWAELQLQRLVELAGLQKHIDFETQVSVGEGERPDLIIYLPNKRCIVVDAKAPMDAYSMALKAADEQERRRHLETHARSLRERIRTLGRKEYWRALSNLSPELVVMYLPAEAILSAAFEADRELLEYAFEQRVLPATPIILLALLKAIAYGWQQQQTLDNAQDIIHQSKVLSERMSVFINHLLELGKELKQAVEKYNKMLGSFEQRVRPALRRIQELQGLRDEIQLLEPIEEMPRLTRALTSDESEKLEGEER